MHFSSKIVNILFLTILLFFGLSTVNIFAGSIKGRVIDSYTHETIIGAAVTLENHKNYVVASDANGKYIIDNLPQGQYVIHAKSLGYGDSYTQNIDISNESQVVTFDIYLKPVTTNINEVEVSSAASKESDVSARTSERLAPNVINVISAKTIESLPDLNVADVMQRVSGVSMMKSSSGNNTTVIIRGMPTRYNSVLVNGVQMPSTSTSGRSVSLEMFGAELAGRIEVVKALTPDLEGDAIGGTVNIIMKQAPDAPFLNVHLGSGYNQYFLDHDFLTFDNKTVAKKDFSELNGPDFLADASIFPRQNLIVQAKKAMPDLDSYLSGGRRFFNKQIGVMFALNAQSNSLANTYDLTSVGIDNTDSLHFNRLGIDYTEHQTYSQSQKRYGGYVKIDYQLNSKNQISFYNSIFLLNELRIRKFADLYTDNGGVSYRPIESQTQTDNSDIFCSTLRGEHKLDNHINIDWTILYAGATSHSPDFARIDLAKLGSKAPILNYKDPVIRNWQWDIDQNKSAYVNIDFKPLLFDKLFEIKVGGMARYKYRKNYQNEYKFQGINPGLFFYPDLLTVPLSNDVSAGSTPQSKMGNAKVNSSNYRAWEDVNAVYGMVITNFGKLQVVAGLRFETTYMTNQHNQDDIQVPVSGSTQSYYDALPGLHLNYKFRDNQNLRFSAYQAINRQGFTEVIPTSDQRAGAGNGNDTLKEAHGNCIDLRYEIYPQPEEVLTAGIFYKKIFNAIEELVSSGSENYNLQNLSNPIPNYGLELVVVKHFGNIGVSANYTYTKSAVEVYKKFYAKGKNMFGQIARSDTGKMEVRPLVGQSAHLLNISTSYRNIRLGFKASITYTMQGFNDVLPSLFYGKDTYQANYHNLGFAIEQKLGKWLFVEAKASNILNSPIIRYIKEDKSNIEKLYNYQTYHIGVKISI